MYIFVKHFILKVEPLSGRFIVTKCGGCCTTTHSPTCICSLHVAAAAQLLTHLHVYVHYMWRRPHNYSPTYMYMFITCGGGRTTTHPPTCICSLHVAAAAQLLTHLHVYVHYMWRRPHNYSPTYMYMFITCGGGRTTTHPPTCICSLHVAAAAQLLTHLRVYVHYMWRLLHNYSPTYMYMFITCGGGRATTHPPTCICSLHVAAAAQLLTHLRVYVHYMWRRPRNYSPTYMYMFITCGGGRATTHPPTCICSLHVAAAAQLLTHLRVYVHYMWRLLHNYSPTYMYMFITCGGGRTTTHPPTCICSLHVAAAAQLLTHLRVYVHYMWRLLHNYSPTYMYMFITCGGGRTTTHPPTCICSLHVAAAAQLLTHLHVYVHYMWRWPRNYSPTYMYMFTTCGGGRTTTHPPTCICSLHVAVAAQLLTHLHVYVHYMWRRPHNYSPTYMYMFITCGGGRTTTHPPTCICSLHVAAAAQLLTHLHVYVHYMWRRPHNYSPTYMYMFTTCGGGRTTTHSPTCICSLHVAAAAQLLTHLHVYVHYMWRRPHNYSPTYMYMFITCGGGRTTTHPPTCICSLHVAAAAQLLTHLHVYVHYMWRWPRNYSPTYMYMFITCGGGRTTTHPPTCICSLHVAAAAQLLTHLHVYVHYMWRRPRNYSPTYMYMFITCGGGRTTTHPPTCICSLHVAAAAQLLTHLHVYVHYMWRRPHNYSPTYMYMFITCGGGRTTTHPPTCICSLHVAAATQLLTHLHVYVHYMWRRPHNYSPTYVYMFITCGGGRTTTHPPTCICSLHVVAAAQLLTHLRVYVHYMWRRPHNYSPTYMYMFTTCGGGRTTTHPPTCICSLHVAAAAQLLTHLHVYVHYMWRRPRNYSPTYMYMFITCGGGRATTHPPTCICSLHVAAAAQLLTHLRVYVHYMCVMTLRT